MEKTKKGLINFFIERRKRDKFFQIISFNLGTTYHEFFNNFLDDFLSEWEVKEKRDKLKEKYSGRGR